MAEAARIVAGRRCPVSHLHTIRELQLERHLRLKCLPAGLFREPCWDMLLDLAACHEEGAAMQVKSLCIGAQVPPTTALRYIDMLTGSGLAESTLCPHDGRRRLISLSSSGASGMQRFLERVEARRG